MTLNEVRKFAQQCAEQKKVWHFHILTPTCRLNDSKKYALVVENSTDSEEYIAYSEEPFMGIGQELVKMLHGTDVIKEKTGTQSIPPSKQVQRLLLRAKELANKNTFWHHHMLFPNCKYNKQQGKWAIVFEDQEKSEIIESVSDEEPKSDLQYIESLFYSQKKK